MANDFSQHETILRFSWLRCWAILSRPSFCQEDLDHMTLEVPCNLILYDSMILLGQPWSFLLCDKIAPWFLCSGWKISSCAAPEQVIQHRGFVTYRWDANRTWVFMTIELDLVTHNRLKYFITIKCLCIAKGRGFLLIC